MGGRLNGRVAIVTGASRGLGRAIAMAMAAEGAAVAVSARTVEVWDDRLPGTIGETVAAIEAAGGRALGVRTDVLNPEERQHLVDEVRAKLGPTTILINNAAFTAPGRPPRPGEIREPREIPRANSGAEKAPARQEWPTFLSTPLSGYRRHFEMVYAAYDLSQMVAVDMIGAGFGAIVNITSAASRMPGAGPYSSRSFGALAGYGGSKVALEHLTQCCAYDLQDENIAVNALSPSKAVRTPGVAYYVKDFSNFASDSEVAEAAVRLALVDPKDVTGRIIGHLEVLDDSFRSFELSLARA
jgi:7-alpha-hydroxysteroid dehydrogenase